MILVPQGNDDRIMEFSLDQIFFLLLHSKKLVPNMTGITLKSDKHHLQLILLL